MTLEELKVELAAILAEEESDAVNWARVEDLCERTYVRLVEPGAVHDFPQDNVIDYLACFRRRREDDLFGEEQRQWLRRFLRG